MCSWRGYLFVPTQRSATTHYVSNFFIASLSSAGTRGGTFVNGRPKAERRLKKPLTRPSGPAHESEAIEKTFDPGSTSRVQSRERSFPQEHERIWHLDVVSHTSKQRLAYETTWRCQKNPFIGALGIQEPVIPGEPLFKG